MDTRCLFAVKEDNTREDFSIVKCIDNIERKYTQWFIIIIDLSLLSISILRDQIMELFLTNESVFIFISPADHILNVFFR
jgi:hypothetical protein